MSFESSANPVCEVIVSRQADVREARRGDREGGVHGDGEQPRREDRVAQAGVERTGAAVEPDESAGHDDELRGEVEVVERPQRDRAGQGLLDVRLRGDAELDLEVEDPVGIGRRGGEVADREPAARAVDEVGEEEERDLRHARRDPSRRAPAEVGGGQEHARDATSPGRAAPREEPPGRGWG